MCPADRHPRNALHRGDVRRSVVHADDVRLTQVYAVASGIEETDVTISIPHKERLTAISAAAFVFSLGVVSAFPSLTSQSFLTVSAASFVALYVSD